MGMAYSKHADVFSYGVLLWEIYTQEDVYPEHSISAVKSLTISGERLKIPADTPPIYAQLIEGNFRLFTRSSNVADCWNQVPENRPTFDEIVSLLNVLAESFEKVITPTADEEPEAPTEVTIQDNNGYDDIIEDSGKLEQ
jgi:hypothetical protein